MGSKTKDLVGLTFGRLTVLSFVKQIGPHSYWIVQCECGNKRTVTANNMKRGNTTSCGCTRALGLKYMPKSGRFYRKGKLVTHVGKNGYQSIQFRHKRSYAHRLAWELMVGPIPPGADIDHINRNRMDNRITNLRLATRSENLQNAITFQGYVHIYQAYDGRKKKWRVRYWESGSIICKGFEKESEAKDFGRTKYSGGF